MQSFKLVLGCFVLTQAIKLDNDENKALGDNIPQIATTDAKADSSDAAKKEVIASQTYEGPVKRRRREKAEREAAQKSQTEQATVEDKQTTATPSSTSTTKETSTSGPATEKKKDVTTAQVSAAQAVTDQAVK